MGVPTTCRQILHQPTIQLADDDAAVLVKQPTNDTPVVAVSAGRVIFVGDGGSYGNLVKIRHASGVETYYAHLSATTANVGQEVQPGDQVGTVGSTGNSTGPHLHLEVRVDGQPTNPTTWLEQKGIEP